jgi:polysaccharide export outer membrane protein
VQYLQKDDVNNKNMPKDSIVRFHKIESYDYRIQPYDILYFDAQSLTDEEFDFLKLMNTSATGGSAVGLSLSGIMVDDNGFIKLPVIGRLLAEGKTLFDLEEEIEKISIEYIDDPQIKIRLLNFRFTVLGEVNRDGSFSSLAPRVSIPEAIGLAGGITELADRANVKIIRQEGDTAKVFYVNLLDEDLVSSPFYYVHQNDIIVVPPLTQRTFRRYFQQNLGLFVSTLSTVLLIITLLLQ